MSSPPSGRSGAGARPAALRFADVCGGLGVLAGVVVLLGWALEIPTSRAFGQGLITVKPWAAVCMIAIGIAVRRLAVPEAAWRTVALVSDPIARGAAATAWIIAGVSLVEWLAGASLGFDTLLFENPAAAAGGAPGRMAPPTALLILFQASALLLVDRREGRGTTATQALASCSGVGTFLILTGYLFGVRDLYSIPSSTAVPLPAACTIAILAAGILALRPSRGLARVLTGVSQGSVLGRRLLPVALLVPVLVGTVVVHRGHLVGVRSSFDWAVAQVATTVVLVSVVFWTALWLHRLDGERRRTERALRETESRFRVMAEAAPVMIWMSGVDGRCTYVNQGWAEFTGRSAEAEVGAAWPAEIHPDDFGGCLDRWQTAFAAREPIDLEFRMRRHDGSWRWIADSGVPLHDEDGSFHGYIGTCFDVTERHRAAEDREHSLALTRESLDRAEQASRLKDEFLALVSHELRTPLNSILGWAQILRTDVGEMASDEVARALEVIERNARTQARLVDDLLDMSRILTGKVRLQTEVVRDLAGLVETAIDGMRPAAQARDIALRVQLQRDDVALLGDPDRLRQIAWNLLSNAVKFTPRGGTVWVALGVEDGEVCLRVRDSGKGIAPEFLPRIFDRFSQQDSGTTRAFGGLGLGLSVVRYLVELHGGTIRATSEGDGQGAELVVRLPILPRAADQPPLAARSARGRDGRESGNGLAPGDLPALAASQLAGKRVLLVDDDPDVLDTIRVILERAGAQVRAVSSALEALGSLREWGPSVLVSDIGMPARDGYWLVRQVRSLPEGEGGAVPAIALTAYARGPDRVDALRSGFDLHLGKPVDAEHLVSAVAAVRRLDS